MPESQLQIKRESLWEEQNKEIERDVKFFSKKLPPFWIWSIIAYIPGLFMVALSLLLKEPIYIEGDLSCLHNWQNVTGIDI